MTPSYPKQKCCGPTLGAAASDRALVMSSVAKSPSHPASDALTSRQSPSPLSLCAQYVHASLDALTTHAADWGGSVSVQ